MQESETQEAASPRGLALGGTRRGGKGRGERGATASREWGEDEVRFVMEGGGSGLGGKEVDDG